MNQFGCRDGRADNAQALKACDPLGRVGSNPTPDATTVTYSYHSASNGFSFDALHAG
jgi:hypothetical protein